MIHSEEKSEFWEDLYLSDDATWDLELSLIHI